MNTPPHLIASSTRRSFLKQSAVAAAVLGVPALLRAANLNSKVQIAAVGVDGMGHVDLENISTHAKINYVGFCDIDTARFAKADAAVPGVPHFRDFRAMLEQLGDKVDAINIAIPDHMHALVAIEAMKRGKHVYCQKPLGHTVWEARQMRLWAAKKGIVTQMGNQGHSALAYRLAVRLLKDGVVGRIKEVRSWESAAGNEATRLLEPPSPGPVPPNVDWNLWVGCAAMREYAPNAYHPFAWRDWQAFGSGAIGDFGCHILDPVFMALDLTAPISILAENSGINRHIWPTRETVRYVFPGNALTAGPTLNLTWMDGGLQPDRKLTGMPGDLDLPKGGGSLFIGESGNLVLPHMAAPRLYPVENFKAFAYPKDLQGFNHYHRWIDAILENGRTTDGFDHAGPLVETVQLGNVATRVAIHSVRSPDFGSEEAVPLQWDAKNLRITNHAVADSLLTTAYRAGWEVTPA